MRNQVIKKHADRQTDHSIRQVKVKSTTPSIHRIASHISRQTQPSRDLYQKQPDPHNPTLTTHHMTMWGDRKIKRQKTNAQKGKRQKTPNKKKTKSKRHNKNSPDARVKSGSALLLPFWLWFPFAEDDGEYVTKRGGRRCVCQPLFDDQNRGREDD